MKKEELAKLRETLRKLFGMLGSSNEHEKNTALNKIHELAAKHNLSWNDVLELVGVTENESDECGQISVSTDTARHGRCAVRDSSAG